MKSLLLPTLTVLAALLLSGCPDNKVPKAPPKVPEPKAAMHSIPAGLHTPHTTAQAPHRSVRTQA